MRYNLLKKKYCKSVKLFKQFLQNRSSLFTTQMQKVYCYVKQRHVERWEKGKLNNCKRNIYFTKLMQNINKKEKNPGNDENKDNSFKQCP